MSAPRERGASALELALCLPLLASLLFGALEFGLIWRSSNALADASRGAILDLSRAVDERDADRRALERVHASVSSSLDTVEWVIVYRSNQPNGSPPVVCRRLAEGLASGSTGINGLCNVYSGAFVRSMAAADFDDPRCSGDADRWLCPATRADTFPARALIGIAISIHHTSVTSVLPGGSRSISDHGVAAVYSE